MPFCPSCRLEYVAGVERCDDCGVRLVEKLPPEPPPKDIHWVELPPLSSESIGRMVVEQLEGRGIRTMLKYDVFVSAFGSQGTVIFVPRDRYDEAKDIQRSLVGD